VAWREAVAGGWTTKSADALVAGRLGAPSALATHAAVTTKTQPAAAAPAPKKGVAPKPERLSKEQARRRRAAIESDLERHGLRKGHLELAMLDPIVIASYTELAKVASELADVTAALQHAEEAWLALEGEVAK
jgi:hypothetical protein